MASPGDPGRETPITWAVNSLNPSRRTASGCSWHINASRKQRPIPSSRLDELHRFGKHGSKVLAAAQPSAWNTIPTGAWLLPGGTMLYPEPGLWEEKRSVHTWEQAAQPQPVHLPQMAQLHSCVTWVVSGSLIHRWCSKRKKMSLFTRSFLGGRGQRYIVSYLCNWTYLS